MQIIFENGIQKLIPSDKEKWILNREELELEEEERYYFKFAYLPASATLEECEEKYVEIKKGAEHG